MTSLREKYNQYTKHGLNAIEYVQAKRDFFDSMDKIDEENKRLKSECMGLESPGGKKIPTYKKPIPIDLLQELRDWQPHSECCPLMFQAISWDIITKEERKYKIRNNMIEMAINYCPWCKKRLEEELNDTI